uniref:Uncharacterized protein n=1 Tax=Trichuris muris TaxID=70415 RepID=A0A5S6Q6X8_TRIMR
MRRIAAASWPATKNALRKRGRKFPSCNPTGDRGKNRHPSGAPGNGALRGGMPTPPAERVWSHRETLARSIGGIPPVATNRMPPAKLVIYSTQRDGASTVCSGCFLNNAVATALFWWGAQQRRDKTKLITRGGREDEQEETWAGDKLLNTAGTAEDHGCGVQRDRLHRSGCSPETDIRKAFSTYHGQSEARRRTIRAAVGRSSDA